MMIKLMLLCKEAYFSDIFTTYANGTQKELSVSMFTGEEKAAAFLSARPGEVQAILADESFFAANSVSGLVKIAISDSTQPSESDDGLCRLNVFQRRQDILRDLKQILTIRLGLPGTKAVTATKVITFFSTQGGGGKTTLGYLTALSAAGRGKAAYLNLECAPRTRHLYQETAQCNVEQFLFAIKDRRDGAKEILPALGRNAHNVYVLPTIEHLADRGDFTAEDAAYLLDVLLQRAELDYLIVDLSAAFSALNDAVFAVSDLVALVYGDDGVGNGKRAGLLSDPGYEALPFAQKAFFVGNRCGQKYAAGRYSAQFPFSQSLGKGVDLTAVLGANKEFSDGCAAILDAAQQ